MLAFYKALPDDPFVTAARAYSEAKLAMLNGDLSSAERFYRTAAEGFSRIDRPIMRSMCVGMVADFDEHSENYPAAIKGLEETVETNDALGLRGFMGAQLVRLGWALLQNGNMERAELMYRRALDVARRLSNAPVIFLALSGVAVLHRLHGRNSEATTAATEALELYLVNRPRRFENRVDPRADVLIAAAVCCVVLASIDAETGNGAYAARLLGQADHLRSDAAAPVPTFLNADLDRAHHTMVTLLGNPEFLAAFEYGRQGQLGDDVAFR